MTEIAAPGMAVPKSRAWIICPLPASMVARPPAEALWLRSVPAMRFEAPVNSATKGSLGALYRSVAELSCRSLPSFITPMRSPSTTASAWSWVT